MNQLSFSGFMGFITGLLFGGALLLARLWYGKRKGIVESDEMTKLIVTRATSTSFWGIGALAFVAWIADNLLRYQRAEEILLYSPWGIVFFATILFYLAAYMYHRWVVTGELVERDKVRKKQAAIGLIVASAAVTPAVLRNSPGVAALRPLGISVVIIAFVQGIFLFVTTKQGRQQ
ncbi:MAG: hypothetical protein ACM3ZQ_02115 [Bacillota bacterium]